MCVCAWLKFSSTRCTTLPRLEFSLSRALSLSISIHSKAHDYYIVFAMRAIAFSIVNMTLAFVIFMRFLSIFFAFFSFSLALCSQLQHFTTQTMCTLAHFIWCCCRLFVWLWYIDIDYSSRAIYITSNWCFVIEACLCRNFLTSFPLLSYFNEHTNNAASKKNTSTLVCLFNFPLSVRMKWLLLLQHLFIMMISIWSHFSTAFNQLTWLFMLSAYPCIIAHLSIYSGLIFIYSILSCNFTSF